MQEPPEGKLQETPMPNRSSGADARGDRKASRVRRQRPSSTKRSTKPNSQDSKASFRSQNTTKYKPPPKRARRRSRPNSKRLTFPNAAAYARRNNGIPSRYGLPK